MIGNNVLAQVPDLNSFVGGVPLVLKPRGTVTMEFPHLLRLIEGNQFDTIYHEHFSYFSLLAVERIFAAHGLTVFDVEELWTHGGSLRVWARHAGDDVAPGARRACSSCGGARRQFGLLRVETYCRFEERARRHQAAAARAADRACAARASGSRATARPARATRCSTTAASATDLLDFTVDRNPYKQGRFLPGTHIPIHPPSRLDETQPDYVLVLPWNLKDEIVAQLAHVRSWGGRFIVPIPEPVVLA